jgi:hypothetical protein
MDTMTEAVTERFVEMIVADQNHVDTEFTALIAAGWPAPPPSLPICTTAVDDGDHDGDKHPQRSPQTTRCQPQRPDHRRTRARSGERAPPTPAIPL